jgi:hypothetical protein
VSFVSPVHVKIYHRIDVLVTLLFVVFFTGTVSALIKASLQEQKNTLPPPKTQGNVESVSKLLVELMCRNIRLKTTKMAHPLYTKKLCEWAKQQKLQVNLLAAKKFVSPAKCFIKRGDIFNVVPIVGVGVREVEFGKGENLL